MCAVNGFTTSASGFVALGRYAPRMTIQSDDTIEEIIAWAEAQSKHILSEGRPLWGFPLALAAEVGVKRYDCIRVLRVGVMPTPSCPDLKSIMVQAGMLRPHLSAMAFGYGVCGPLGFTTGPILAYQFRRVQQYEAAGSIADFMREYITQIEQFGYQDAPHNVDARAHQHIRPIARLRR